MNSKATDCLLLSMAPKQPSRDQKPIPISWMTILFSCISAVTNIVVERAFASFSQGALLNNQVGFKT